MTLPLMEVREPKIFLLKYGHVPMVQPHDLPSQIIDICDLYHHNIYHLVI